MWTFWCNIYNIYKLIYILVKSESELTLVANLLGPHQLTIDEEGKESWASENPQNHRLDFFVNSTSD